MIPIRWRRNGIIIGKNATISGLMKIQGRKPILLSFPLPM
jgi:hypothetical protein